MTIIEILVVLVIFAVGWFAILPNLDLMRATDSRNTGLEEFNTFVAQARLMAMKNNLVARLTVNPGRKAVAWDGASVNLPATVRNCVVNGRQFFDRPTEFRIFPEGSMDEVRITLDGGQVLRSNTLGGDFAVAQ
jgi:Tfp pilus assembly protein FimT